VIDEAQLSKKLGGYVRFFKEKWQKQRVILTGSTLSDLFKNHARPTGRVVEFILRPFNFYEFLTALNKQSLLEKLSTWTLAQKFSPPVHAEFIKTLQQYLLVGGLPAVALAYAKNQDYQTLLANIFSFYKRDFENKATDKLTNIFSQCFLRIAAATGSPIKNASIIQSSSPGYHKVAAVLATLDAWHQIIKVECEVSKLSKVGSLTPKRYIFDHGIRYLQNPARFKDMDLNQIQNLSRSEVGGILENFVLTELLSLGSALPIRSWSKTNQSGEVDFIYQNNTDVTAIEVKAAMKFNRKHLSGLLALHDFYPKTKLILTNLTAGGVSEMQHTKILNIPVYALYRFLRESKLG
jgi:predicted AAA+ superfamily ATPase